MAEPVLPVYGQLLPENWLVVLVRADPRVYDDDLPDGWHRATWRVGAEDAGWWTVMLSRSGRSGNYEQWLFVHRPGRGWEELRDNPAYVAEWADSDYTEKPYIMTPTKDLPWQK